MRRCECAPRFFQWCLWLDHMHCCWPVKTTPSFLLFFYERGDILLAGQSRHLDQLTLIACFSLDGVLCTDLFLAWGRHLTTFSQSYEVGLPVSKTLDIDLPSTFKLESWIPLKLAINMQLSEVRPGGDSPQAVNHAPPPTL